jgi:general secretion pathway protein D
MFRPTRTAHSLSSALCLGLAATTFVAPLAAQDAPPLATPDAPAPAAAPAKPAEMVGPLILRDEQLSQVLDLIERWTGRTLLRPASLPPGTYTLNLDKPLPKADALRALETLLNMNGVGLSPLGTRFLKVAPLNLIRTEAPEFVEGSTLELPAGGRIIAKLFTLEFLRVAEFVPQASQLLNPALGSAPVLFEKNNAVLITDSVSTLQRIEQLLATLDRPTAAGLAVKNYTVTNAKASDLVNKLRSLLSGPLQAQIGATTIYQPDDRTNQVLLISDVREQPFFDSLISRLDAEASPNTRSDVIFLKHANATEVATLLGQLVTGQNTAASRDSSSGTRPTGTRARNAAAAPATPAAPAVTPAVTNLVEGAAASEEFSSLLTIVADERSNAIVVAGTPNDIKLVASLVDRLDVLLAQVRIEVVIAEVTLQDDSSSGIGSLGLNVVNNKLVGFSSTFAGGTIGGTATTTGTGANAVTTTSPFAQIKSFPDGSYDLSGTVGLTTTPRKNNATILQTPSIVTTHNKEAEIFVGETRPVISGTTTSNAGGVNPGSSSSTVTQQEIGIRLRVLPLIGSSGDVQLEVEQEVEDVLGTVTIDGNEQPRIGRRTTNSYVSARNGDIIVLGGLQRASQSKTSSRLGPIPLIGDLLGSRGRTKGRTELVFFLRPIILTNTPADNVEAMRRVDSTPQSKEVRTILEVRPAAAPDGDTVPPREPTPPAPESTRATGPAGKR